MLPLASLVILLSLPATALITPTKNLVLPPLLVGRPPGGFLRTALRTYVDEPDDSTYAAGNFTQKLDHFNATDDRTFAQHFWHNTALLNTSLYSGRELVFLVLGGASYGSFESVTDDSWQVVKWSEHFGARLFRLEHRMFERTRSSVLAAPQLEFLTTDQAVQDAVNFATTKSKDLGMVDPVWIVFGDSYSGKLAARLRAEHPNVFAAAVVSSGFVHTKKELPEFSNAMDKLLKETLIKEQNVTCATWLTGLVADLHQYPTNYDEDIMLEPPFSSFHRVTGQQKRHFYASVFGLMQAFMEFSYNTTDALSKKMLSTSHMCNSIVNSDDPMTKNIFFLYQWYASLYTSANITGFPNNYDRVVRLLKDASNNEAETDVGESIRWLWMACNEIGMFPVTDLNSIFKDFVTIDYYDVLCSDVFEDRLQQIIPNSSADYKAGHSLCAPPPFGPIPGHQHTLRSRGAGSVEGCRPLGW